MADGDVVLAWTIGEGSWTAHDRALGVTVTISEEGPGDYRVGYSMGDMGDPYHIDEPEAHVDFVQAERAAVAQLKAWSDEELADHLETRDEDAVAGDDGGV